MNPRVRKTAGLRKGEEGQNRRAAAGSPLILLSSRTIFSGKC